MYRTTHPSHSSLQLKVFLHSLIVVLLLSAAGDTVAFVPPVVFDVQGPLALARRGNTVDDINPALPQGP